MSIIRAKVLTPSSEDKFARVKIKSEGLWEESTLIESLSAVPLIKDDIVHVYVDNDLMSPLVLGRALTSAKNLPETPEGSILFCSADKDETNLSICFVKNNKFTLVTKAGSKKAKTVIDGGKITIEADGDIDITTPKLTVNNHLEVK